MWEEPSEDSDASPEPAPTAPIAWSNEQLIRIENEWRRLQRQFAYHPAVEVTPLGGDPPGEYQVDLQLQTLELDAAGALSYTQTCCLHVWLGAGFPHEPPLIRPMSNLFHPNVSPDAILLPAGWTPLSTLADTITAVAELLAFRVHDLNYPLNPTAAQWVADNPRLLPTDAVHDFAPDAGGEPLGRICRFAPATLQTFRSAIDSLADSLFDAAPPELADLQTFCDQTRLGLTLFLDADVPDNLRSPAAELDDFARQLPAARRTFLDIASQLRSAAGAAADARQLGATRERVALAVRDIDRIGQLPDTQDVREILRSVPELGTLQHHIGRLGGLLADFVPQLAATRAHQSRLRQATAPAPAGSGLLLDRLSADSARAAAELAMAQRLLTSELHLAVPLAHLAGQRLDGLQRLAAFREFHDLSARADEIGGHLRDWGSAGVEAFYVESGGETFGPFCVEQPMAVGGTEVVLRNPAPTSIDVIEAESGKVLGHSELGSLAIDLGSARPAPKTIFRFTGRCDELAVQLDYLIAQARQVILGMFNPLDAGDSWIGIMLESLLNPMARDALLAFYADGIGHWSALSADLKALAPFKNRLITHHLIERVGRVAPAISAERTDAKSAMATSTQRLAEISRACTIDIDTGRMQIPAKYAAEYAAQVAKRQKAAQDLAELSARVATLAAEIKARISSPELLGAFCAPVFTSLSLLPDELLNLESSLLLERLRAAVGEVSHWLATELAVTDNAARDLPRPQAVGEEASDDLDPASGSDESISSDFQDEDQDVIDLGPPPRPGEQ